MLVLVAETDLGGAVIFFMVFVMMLYLATENETSAYKKQGASEGFSSCWLDICFLKNHFSAMSP